MSGKATSAARSDLARARDLPHHPLHHRNLNPARNDELKQLELNDTEKVTSITQPDGQCQLAGLANSTSILVFHDILVGNYTFQASTDDFEDLELM